MSKRGDMKGLRSPRGDESRTSLRACRAMRVASFVKTVARSSDEATSPLAIAMKRWRSCRCLRSEMSRKTQTVPSEELAASRIVVSLRLDGMVRTISGDQGLENGILPGATSSLRQLDDTKDVFEGSADGFLLSPACQGLCERIEKPDLAITASGDNRVAHIIEQGVPPRLALAQLARHPVTVERHFDNDVQFPLLERLENVAVGFRELRPL